MASRSPGKFPPAILPGILGRKRIAVLWIGDTHLATFCFTLHTPPISDQEQSNYFQNYNQIVFHSDNISLPVLNFPII